MPSWMNNVRAWLKPADQRPRDRNARLAIESLEDRATPSITVGGTAPLLGVTPAWTSVGPAGVGGYPLMVVANNGPVNGPVETMAVDPGNPSRVAVGTVNGGVWITDNFTAASPTWATTTDNLASLAVSAIAFSPVNPNQLYIGTGSYTDGQLGTTPGAGLTTGGIGGAPGYVYRSDDGGRTWTQVGGATFGGRRIRDVVPTSLNNGQTVFLATTDATTPVNTGLYRSDTSGSSWVRVSGTNGLPDLPVTDFIPDARNGPGTGVNRFYAATVGGTGAGIYMLDAAGGNTAWVNIGGNLTVTNLFATSSRILVASTGAGAGPVWAAFVSASTNRVTAVYRGVSFNGTYLWSAVGPQGQPPNVTPTQRGHVHLGFAADPTSDTLVYLSGDSSNTTPAYAPVVRGDSTANTWTTVALYPGTPTAAPAGTVNPTVPTPAPTTAPPAESRDLRFAPDGSLLLSGDGGIFRATNPRGVGSAPVWTSIGGNIQAFEEYGAAVDNRGTAAAADDVFLAGYQDTGLGEGPAGGQYQSVAAGTGVQVFTDSTGPYRYYVNSGFGLRRRDPNGTLAVPAGTIVGLSGFTLNAAAAGTRIETLPFQPAVALNQAYPASMLVGGNGTLYLSFDRGNTFRSVSPISGNTPARIFPGVATAVAFGTAQAPNAAYVAASDGNLYFSVDLNNAAGGFLSPSDFPAVALGRPALEVAMDPNNPLIAYAVTDRGVFRTANGVNWTSVTGNLLGLTSPGGLITLTSLTLFTNNTANSQDDAVVVGGYGGVFSLGVSNTAAGWTRVATGFPNVLATGVEYDPLGDSLVAATYGRGSFKVDSIGATLAPGLLVTVTGDFGDNDMAVWADPAAPQFFFVSDGLGNVQRFDSAIYRAVSFVGQSGADTVRVGAPDAGTPGTAHLLRVNVLADGGGNPGDVILIDDRSDTAGRQTTVTPTLINRGQGDNLLGGAGVVSYTGFDAGSVQVLFGTGADTLRADDTDSAANTTYALDGGQVRRSTGGPPLQFLGLEQLVVLGGSGTNTYQVSATAATAGTTLVDGEGGGTFNVRADGLTGATAVFAAGGDDTVNVTAGAGVAGPVQVTGGTGNNTLNFTGRAAADTLTFTLRDAAGSATLTGAGQQVQTAQVQRVNLNGQGANALTWRDNSGVGFGTPTDPDAGVVYSPSGLTAGRVVAGRGGNGVPGVSFAGVTGPLTIAAPTSVITVYGVSDDGLQAAGEATAADGRDTVTVSDRQVAVANSSLGVLKAVSLLSGGDAPAALFVRTGNERGPAGDTVAVTASATLNIVVDGGRPNGTAPGDRAQVLGAGEQTRAQLDDPSFGPPQIRVQFADGTSAGLIGFESSAGGVAGVGALAVGSGPGVPAQVQVIDPVTGNLKFTVFPFGGFAGGVTAATGDLTGDGIPDLVVGAGPGGGPSIAAYDGATQALLGSIYAFEPTFTGGVNVSLGDFNNDGYADIVLGTGVGGGPRVRVLDGKNLSVIRDVFVYEPSFRGGVSVAVGDVNQDGVPDLITSAGAGGGPRVVIFDGANLRQVASFYVFDPASRDGFHVGAGDVTGDGVADVVVGYGSGGPSLVRVFTGTNLRLVTEFNVDQVGAGQLPFIPLGSGVRVATADIDGDGVNEVVTAKGPGSTPTLRYYQVGRINPESNAIEINLRLLRQQDVFDPLYSAGIFLGQSS